MPDTIQSTHDDVELVRLTSEGSREAYGLLVVRHSRSVRATCLARLGTVDDLDDLVQETFLRAYQGLSRLKDHSRFGAYVHRIAKNISIDRLRRQPKSPVSLEDINLVPAQAESPSDMRDERLHRVRQMVGRLPHALREAVFLFYFEELTHAAIAGQLGVTEAAVNQRLHRARRTLRDHFDRDGNGDRDVAGNSGPDTGPDRPDSPDSPSTGGLS